MSVTVRLNYVRHSPRKLRPVLAMFAGKKLDQAIEQSGLMKQHSAQFLNKVLRSASAAAEEKQLASAKMVIAELFATDGPKVKRIRANAKGRTNKYVKHIAHLTVVIKEDASAPASTAPVKTKTKIETTVRKKK